MRYLLLGGPGNNITLTFDVDEKVVDTIDNPEDNSGVYQWVDLQETVQVMMWKPREDS